MPFTRGQRAKLKSLEQFASLAEVDFWNLDPDLAHEEKNARLDLFRDSLVRITILSNYLLIDELVTSILCRYFFPFPKSFIKLWKTRHFQNFNYHIVEELSLMKKVALVKAIKPVPKRVVEIIRLTNVLRNAIAHSFFPTNKRDFRHMGKVTYKGKDVFTLDGLALFNTEATEATQYLLNRAFPGTHT